MSTILNILALVLFGLAVNTAAFAVKKYMLANRRHRDRVGVQYSGPLPRHIWKTALGTALTLIGGAYFVADNLDQFNGVHAFFLLGFGWLFWGMRELLLFERSRLEVLRRRK